MANEIAVNGEDILASYQIGFSNVPDDLLIDLTPMEIIESTAINQLVPTLLITSLKSYLVPPKFIINVASLEGQFSTKKDGNHVHTNMHKAALNMLKNKLGIINETTNKKMLCD
mgnify:CR=1 FL=1